MQLVHAGGNRIDCSVLAKIVIRHIADDIQASLALRFCNPEDLLRPEVLRGLRKRDDEVAWV